MLRFLRRLLRQSKTTGAVVVKRRLSPRVKLLIFGAIGLVVLSGANFLYEHGVSMAGFERAFAKRLQTTLEEENRRLREEVEQLRLDKARMERSLQMAEVVHEDVQKALFDRDQENAKLREEVSFYRNIISPADRKSGLRIQSLNVEPLGGSSSAYRYKLVVIQALKHERTISGTARLEIVGTQGGQDATIRIPGNDERPIRLNLKYFQDIEGKFELPRGFRAQSIKVSVTPSGGGQVIEATYDWPHA